MANEPIVTPAAPVAEVKPEAIVTKPEAVIEDAPIVESPKKKIKWGDTEKEVTFDEAVQLAQKAFGIENKAREASQKAQQAEALLDMLQNKPNEFAKRAKAIGLDPQKLATEILYEQIRINSLTPEQRELEELKAKETERTEAEKATAEAAKQAEVDAKTKEWGKKFETDLQAALEKKSLPMTRLTLALAANYINAGLKEKKEFTVEQVVPFVMRDLKNIQTSTLGNLEGEALLNYIGEDISNKIAKARVERYKKGQVPPVPKTPKTPEGSLPKDVTKLKGKAYWKALRQLKTAAGVGAFPGQE